MPITCVCQDICTLLPEVSVTHASPDLPSPSPSHSPTAPTPRLHFAVPGKRPGDFHTAPSPPLRQPPPTPSVNNRRDGRTLRNCGRTQRGPGTFLLSLCTMFFGRFEGLPRSLLFVQSVGPPKTSRVKVYCGNTGNYHGKEDCD